ncbi:HNH endonuclease [Chroococcidiopsidales cyanobacterium LEGE 13417]|nr:HNH endonuclease [Chroococcidiopsidales cyanobacterium LEGE 13417]
MDNLTFDAEKHYLGKLCRSGHNWNSTGKSVRYQKCQDCVICIQERNQRRDRKVWLEENRKKGIDCSEVGAYYLGALCRNGHDWQGSGKSIRYNCDTKCVRCRLGDSWIPRNWRPKQTEEEAKAKRKQYCATHSAEAVARVKIWRQNNPERARNLERRCYERNRDRHKQLAKEHYHQNRAAYAVIQKRYRQSDKGRTTRLNYYYQNRERILERQRRYCLSESYKTVRLAAYHRRRSRKLKNHSAPYTVEQIQTLKKLFNNRCAYCSKAVSLTLDHFVPVAKGGPDCLGNLIPACLSCNSSKRDLDAQEWYERQPFYCQRRWKDILRVLGKTVTNGQLPLF